MQPTAKKGVVGVSVPVPALGPARISASERTRLINDPSAFQRKCLREREQREEAPLSRYADFWTDGDLQPANNQLLLLL
jgi:hypothetical protein